MDEYLGENPTLPLGLTLFLAEGTAKEQGEAPSSSTPMPMYSPWPPLSKGPQCNPTYMGGAWPKVPAKPSTAQLRSQSRPKGGPDPVNHLCQWVLGEMNRIRGHPHWWKEIRASGRISMGEHIVRECYIDAKALHYAQWQAVEFKLPLAQHKASGWWMPGPGSVGCVPRISCPILMPSALRISGL